MEADGPAPREPFGRLLKRLRLAAGLSQEDLAERAGVSWRTISDLERGVKQGPRPSTLRLLAGALTLSAEERAALQASAFPPAAGGVASAAPQAPIPTNLPLALTSFVGRNQDMATLRRLLGQTRLLTLTGAGGWRSSSCPTAPHSRSPAAGSGDATSTSTSPTVEWSPRSMI